MQVQHLCWGMESRKINYILQVVYPLHLAARKSHILCMQLLRFAGFDIDFATEEGSALHVAALHGEIDAVRFLLREG